MFLVSGGHYGSYLDSTELFDPSLGSWRAGAALPKPLYGLTATTIDNRVLLFGNDILLTFDIRDDKKASCSKYLQVVMTLVALVAVISTLFWSMTSLETPTLRLGQ